MSSLYPGGTDTFTNPTGANTLNSPDHAAQHTNINDSMVAVQTTLGSNAGTSVLKNFAVGQFPIRVTGGAATGTLVQTIVGGTLSAPTINNPVIGTPSVTNGTLQSVVGTHTTNNLNAKGLHSATTVVDVSAATAPTSGQILTATGSSAATWQTSSTIAKAGTVGVSGTTTSVTNVQANGTVQVITTATTHIFVSASVGFVGTASEQVIIQLSQAGTAIGAPIRADCPAANARAASSVSTIMLSQAAGTYNLGLQFRSGAGQQIILDTGELVALAVPA